MRILYIILLLLWFILGWFLCKTYICNASAAASTTAVGAAPVSKGDCDTKLLVASDNLELSSKDNFKFKSSTYSMEMPSKDLQELITKLGKYLKENPDKGIRVSGLYSDAEAKATEKLEETLGAARARAIKNYLIGKEYSPNQIQIGSEITDQGCYKDDHLLNGGKILIGALSN